MVRPLEEAAAFADEMLREEQPIPQEVRDGARAFITHAQTCALCGAKLMEIIGHAQRAADDLGRLR